MNERAAKLVMEYERTHPGTAVHAFTGHDRAAMDVIDGLVEDAVRGKICSKRLNPKII